MKCENLVGHFLVHAKGERAVTFVTDIHGRFLDPLGYICERTTLVVYIFICEAVF